MTLVYELDLSILRMYLCAKNEVSRQMFSKLRARTGQTDRRDRTYYDVAFAGSKITNSKITSDCS